MGSFFLSVQGSVLCLGSGPGSRSEKGRYQQFVTIYGSLLFPLLGFRISHKNITKYNLFIGLWSALEQCEL